MPGRPRIHANASARAAASAQAALARGVRRRGIMLTPEAQEALAQLRETGAYPNDSAAVCAALERAARRIRHP